MDEELRCRICNQTEQWHKEHSPRHQFQVESTRFRQSDSGGKAGVTLPSDPILRLVLIRKGVISAEELTEVERELKSAGVVTSYSDHMGFTRIGGPDNGNGEEPVPQRGVRTRSSRSTSSTDRATEPKSRAKD